MTMIEKKYENNDILSAIILWGIAHVEQDPKEKNCLEKKFSEYKEEGFIPLIEQGINLLRKSVDEALKLIGSAEIFGLKPKHPKMSAKATWLYNATMEAMATFEDVACLHEALLFWERLHQLDGYVSWLRTVEKMHWDICYPDKFSMWYRLIPINRHRQCRLKAIAPIFWDCFPWLGGDSASYSEDALEELVEDMAGYAPDFSSCRNPLYQDVDLYDPDLAGYLEEQAKMLEITKDLPEIFADTHEVRWLVVAGDEGDRVPPPDRVVLTGLMAVALRAMCQKILEKCHPLEWRFWTAFCGPYISDNDRLDVFMDVRRALEAETVKLSENPLLSRVNECLCHRKMATDMSRETFREWRRLLEETANSFPAEEQETVPEDALEKLLAMPDEQARGFAEKILGT